MDQPTQTQGSAAAPTTTNGAAPPQAAAPVADPSAPDAQVTPPAGQDITIDEVDAIIAQRRAKRQREQEQQQAAPPPIPPEVSEKLKTAETQLEAYKRAMREIEVDPLRSLRVLGFKDENIQRMLSNMQLEGQPVHHAVKRVDELEQQLAQLNEERRREREEQEKNQKAQMTRQQIEYAQSELSKLHQVAEQMLGKDNIANAYWGERPREAWDHATEFAEAWCEKHQKETCPYPEIVRYLEQRARRDAALHVERFAAALGWAKQAEAPRAETTPPAPDGATPAPTQPKKKRIDVSKLSREERIALAEAELQKVRASRQKG